ncbi:M48 family metalloprotease [bacterium]|nr:M48 family metalloprotease [bacterium]
MIMLKRIVAILLLTVLILSCGVNPITGKQELMLFTEEQEIEYGKLTDQQIAATYGFYNDAGLTAYIDAMGQGLAKGTHRPNLEYHFKVLDSPVVNAFAAPGGYIYLTRGILAYLNNEAEVAAVIGHELGHVAARHSMRSLTRAAVFQLGLGIGSALSDKIAEAAPYAQLGAQLLFLSFSRSDEYQADSLGVEYSTKAGYDSEKMADFFTSLERMNPEAAASGLPAWFSTHPNSSDRIKRVLKKSTAWKQRVNLPSYRVNRDALMARIDNLVYGEDPRQGYVLNGMFYHPEMRFQFPVPAGWQVQNTPTQVVMGDANNKAAIVFTLAQQKDLDAAAGEFAATEGLTVLSRQPLRIHGLQARQIASQFTQNEQTVKLFSRFIAKDGAVYVFHGLAAEADYDAYQSFFTSTSGDFSTLSDRARINVTPARLTVARVPRAQTLQAFLQSQSVAAADSEKLAVLNGMQLNEMLDAGTRVKLIRK